MTDNYLVILEDKDPRNRGRLCTTEDCLPTSCAEADEVIEELQLNDWTVEALLKRVEGEDRERMIEAMGKAVETERGKPWHGPFGLFDYSPGTDGLGFHIRDFRDPNSKTWGRTISRFATYENAKEEYDRVTRAHFAEAALKALEGLGHIWREVPFDQKTADEIMEERDREHAEYVRSNKYP